MGEGKSAVVPHNERPKRETEERVNKKPRGKKQNPKTPTDEKTNHTKTKPPKHHTNSPGQHQETTREKRERATRMHLFLGRENNV